MTLAEESGWSRQRRQYDADLDITPMIDVTFLLLIFFMVASTMQGRPDLNVPAAEHGQGIETRYAVTFFITTSESGDQPATITDDRNVPYTIEQMAARVREEIAGGKQKLILRADGRAPAGFVDRLLRAVRDVPNVEYAVGVREKKRF